MEEEDLTRRRGGAEKLGMRSEELGIGFLLHLPLANHSLFLTPNS